MSISYVIYKYTYLNYLSSEVTTCRKYINDKTLKSTILLQQRCIACLFLGKTTNYPIKVYLFCNVKLNTEPSQACKAILTDGGSEIVFDELKLLSADATMAGAVGTS